MFQIPEEWDQTSSNTRQAIRTSKGASWGWGNLEWVMQVAGGEYLLRSWEKLQQEGNFLFYSFRNFGFERNSTQLDLLCPTWKESDGNLFSQKWRIML